MGKFPCQFILTGSSARKLKRGGANLLAGRAVERYLFPFTYAELRSDFKLGDALRFGTLPPLYEKEEKEKIDILSAYTHVYLREEIQEGALVRNLGGFTKFLELAASQSGELLSFSAVARECQLQIRTVQSYYEILEDTLIGFRLEAWRKSVRKRMGAHPKFYLFDTGVTNAINHRLKSEPDSSLFRKLFEQWIILETYRMLHYLKSESRLFFWRTNHGAEVDLLIEKGGRPVAAYEIKASAQITSVHSSGLRMFQKEYPTVSCGIICMVPHSYQLEEVRVLPWIEYLKELPEVLG